MLRILIIAAMMLGAGVVLVERLDEMSRTASTPPRPAAATVVSTSPARMVLQAGRNGHFEVEARVDGRAFPFMVDTGASTIALRASDAARLGLRPAPRDFTVKISTANGEARAAPVELRTVEVGNIMVRNLRALVLFDEALNVNLLGMSFLSRIRWTHDRGRLVLEQ
jgi:aspartyl protease family protein